MHTQKKKKKKKYHNGISETWFFEKFIYPYEIQNKHCLFLYLNFPKNNTEQICFFKDFFFPKISITGKLQLKHVKIHFFDCKPVTNYSNMSFFYVHLQLRFLKKDMRQWLQICITVPQLNIQVWFSNHIKPFYSKEC